MKILLSGANGQLGESFKKIFKLNDPLTRGIELVALSREELDITHYKDIEKAFLKHAPNFFINAAAYTAVDQAEDRKDEAKKINADALEYIAELCQKYHISPLHVSTDYVFDGTKSEPYHEDDSTCPVNVYGKTKLEGEKNLIATCENAIILRTCWVFSEFGQNFLKTMLRLAKTKKKLSIVSDQVGGPTYAPDIARAILLIARESQNQKIGKLYHFSGKPYVSWHQFAQEIFKQANVDIELKAISSSEFPTKAIRPQFSKLDCSRFESLASDFGTGWKRGVAKSLKYLK